ncbi:MAG: hypothetical protein JST16_00045 [Bdellovibrionales bacterium]|nr:hypothetical protein [Bdellovibrionales bacterium]
MPIKKIAPFANTSLLALQPDPCFLVGRDGIILDAHIPTSASQFLRHNLSAGSPCADLFPAEVILRVRATIDRAFLDMKTKFFEYSISEKVHIDCEVKVTPVSQDHFVMTITDITERKRQDLEVIYSSKMSSLGEMTAGVAHEINNSIAIILGRVSQLRSLVDHQSVTPERVGEIAEKIDKTCMRVSKFISNLRSYARNDRTEEFAKTSVQKVISEAHALCEDRFKNRGIEFRTQTEPSAQIYCQNSQICQVILSLLNNSFDAICTLPEKWVEIESRQTNGQVEILVTDSGPRIDNELALKIHQPYFTTKEKVKTVGLSLEISRNILRRHGGSLRIDTQCPHARFIVCLPLAQESASSASEREA